MHLGPEEVVIYPWMFVRGYVMVMEIQTAKRLREILQGNPMWMDETYKVHILIRLLGQRELAAPAPPALV